MTEFNWLSELGIVGLALVALIITLVVFYKLFSRKIDTVTGCSNGYAKSSQLGTIHEKINAYKAEQDNECAARLARCNDNFLFIRTTLAVHDTKLDTILKEVKNGKGG